MSWSADCGPATSDLLLQVLPLRWLLQVVALVALAVSRAANVFPISALVNYLRPSDLRIPGSQQFVMWWAGLRGAMAFALALEAAGDLPGAPAPRVVAGLHDNTAPRAQGSAHTAQRHPNQSKCAPLSFLLLCYQAVVAHLLAAPLSL